MINDGAFTRVFTIVCAAFQHEESLENLDLGDAQAESMKNKMSRIHSNFLYCLNELGVWLALKVFILFLHY